MSKQSRAAESIPHTIDRLIQLKEETKRNPRMSISDWHKLFQVCHELYGMMGAICTSDHWQSPAFDQVYVDEAGDERKQIISNVNDYKRDQHPIGIAWEKAYARAFLTHSFVTTPNAFATTSGMAALTVATLIVQERLPKEYRIAVGRHSYFENLELLHMVFPKQNLYMFDEDHADTLLSLRPHAVFFDLLANDPAMTVADAGGIIRIVGKMGYHVDVVIDTTCTSIAHLQVPVRFRMTDRISIIGFESLNKYHQFGLDRTTGGVIWAKGVMEDAIYRTRDHAGVNISENAAMMLPTPHKVLHTAYLQQLERNAHAIAYRLERLSHIRVSFSGLPNHPDTRIAKRIGYTGSFVSISFPESGWRRYRTAMQKIMQIAKQSGVPIVAGSTFGMPITRVYTWTPRSAFEKPFLRIAAGLETPEEIARVCEVLEHALS